MRKNTVKGIIREKTGTKNAKKLRRQGRVPCVLYGGDKSYHISVDKIQIEKLFYAPYVNEITIDLGDEKRNTVIQDAQFHPVTDNLFHIDLLEIHEDVPVTVDVPVKTIGIPEGVRTGGRLRVNFSKVPVKALPSKIPETLEVNVEEMQVGDIIRIQDLPYENIEFVRQPERVVIAVKALADLEELEAELEGEDEEGEEGEEGEKSAEGEGEGAEGESKEGEKKEEKAES